MKVIQLKNELRKYSNVERKKINEKFFKTGQGEYGEGDKFIGVRVPDIHKVARQFKESKLHILEKLLNSKIHKERLLALLILKEQNKQAIKNQDKKWQSKIVKFYLKNRKRINSWDLVDLSTHHILGQAILAKVQDKNILNQLIIAKSMWDRRMAIVATVAFIRQGEISTTLRLSRKLLKDKEDLIHKAMGWMLREAWKKDDKKAQTVEDFLVKNYTDIPRTALRYAIERMPEKQRKLFLRGKFIG